MEVSDVREKSLLELERRFWLEGGANPAFWQRHFADNGLVVLPIGIIGKAETMEAMRNAKPWLQVDMQDVCAVELAETVVLLAYQVSAIRQNSRDPYRAAVGSVYTRIGDDWLLAAHQQSPSK